MLISGLGGQLLVSKREPFLESQIHQLRPTPFSHLLLSRPPRKHLPSPSFSSYTPTLALFESKTKAPTKKQLTSKRITCSYPSTGLEKAVTGPGKGFLTALGLKEGGPLFGFTKANELFLGRLAQLGIAFSTTGEIITGKGALAQLNSETGVPINDIEPLVLINIFFAALNPGTGKFVTDEDEEE